VGVDTICCKRYGVCGEPYSKDITFDENVFLLNIGKNYIFKIKILTLNFN